MLGLDFPDIVGPVWSTQRGRRLFYWGMVHLVMFYTGMFLIGKQKYQDHCQEFWGDVASWFRMFGWKEDDEDFQIWFLSVLFYANEYIFAFLWIYIQMFESYDKALGAFVGEHSLVYLTILPRFSITRSCQKLAGKPISDPETFLKIVS